jgi:hypothetical protein
MEPSSSRFETSKISSCAKRFLRPSARYGLTCGSGQVIGANWESFERGEGWGTNVVEFAEEARESYVPVVVEGCVAEDEDAVLWVKEN